MSQTPPPIHDDSSAANPADPATRAQKIIIGALWSVLLLVIVGVVVGKLVAWSHADSKQKSSPSGRSNEVLFAAPQFALTDQDGKAFSADNLRGKAYICDFIFTSCGSICPAMTHKLAEVQKDTPASLQLVSFTVNPEHDIPAVLKTYAEANGADPSRWHFLTGTPKQMLDVVHAMNLAFEPANKRTPILHSPKFLLVDGDGNVRGVFDSSDAQQMKDLVADAEWLAGTPGAKGK